MAELKNNFTGAKINKDVDKKILPKNEYREAQNISIPESNDEGVGSAEPILGNELNYNTPLAYASGSDVIGYYVDELNQKVYWFVTDQTGESKGTNLSDVTATLPTIPAGT